MTSQPDKFVLYTALTPNGLLPVFVLEELKVGFDYSSIKEGNIYIYLNHI